MMDCTFVPSIKTDMWQKSKTLENYCSLKFIVMMMMMR